MQNNIALYRKNFDKYIEVYLQIVIYLKSGNYYTFYKFGSYHILSVHGATRHCVYFAVTTEKGGYFYNTLLKFKNLRKK